MPVIVTRTSRRYGFAAATLALGLAAICLSERAARVFLPPLLDSSTPAVQSGFKIERINRGEIFFSVPRLPVEYDARLDKPNAHDLFTVTTRTPDGDLHSHGCDIAEIDGKQLLRTVITKTWPESIPWIDLFVGDIYGHSGRWRLTRLSPLQPHLIDVFPGSDTFHFGGLTIHAETTRQWDDSVPASWPKPGRFGMVQALIRATGVPTPQAHWEMGHFSAQDNWDTLFPGMTRDVPWGNTCLAPIVLTTRKPTLYPGPAEDCPYPSQVRQLDIAGTLHQFDSHDEIVTFHNVDLRPNKDLMAAAPWDSPRYRYATVAQTQCVTTPSGIVVTLPAQDTEKPWNYYCAIHLIISPDKTLNTLPASPLYQHYHRPVTLSILASNPPVTVIAGAPGKIFGCAFGWPPLSISHLKTLTFTIRQRIELQSIPFHLTVEPQDSILHVPSR